LASCQDDRLTNCFTSHSLIYSLTDLTHSFFCFQARLPKGIRNIRPHIDNVDNVPLLVSLFTDCTPDSQ